MRGAGLVQPFSPPPGTAGVLRVCQGAKAAEHRSHRLRAARCPLRRPAPGQKRFPRCANLSPRPYRNDGFKDGQFPFRTSAFEKLTQTVPEGTASDAGRLLSGFLRRYKKETCENREPVPAQPWPRQRTWASTAYVANALLSIFVPPGCLILLPLERHLPHHSLTLRYFNSPRVGTGGGGRGVEGRAPGGHYLPSRVNGHTTNLPGSHLYGDQEPLNVQRRGGRWGQEGLYAGSGQHSPAPDPPWAHAMPPHPLPRGNKGRVRTLHRGDPEHPGFQVLPLPGCSVLYTPRPEDTEPSATDGARPWLGRAATTPSAGQGPRSTAGSRADLLLQGPSLPLDRIHLGVPRDRAAGAVPASARTTKRARPPAMLCTEHGRKPVPAALCTAVPGGSGPGGLRTSQGSAPTTSNTFFIRSPMRLAASAARGGKGGERLPASPHAGTRARALPPSPSAGV